GVILDASTHAVIAMAPVDAPWVTAAFAPNGNLVTATAGTLTLRDPLGNAIAPLAVGVAAAVPAVSPDGRLLAYNVLDAAGPSAVGNAVRIQPLDPATGTLGAPIVAATGGTAVGFDTPEFSPDATSLLYSRTANSGTEHPRAGAAVVSLDGTQTHDVTTDT